MRRMPDERGVRWLKSPWALALVLVLVYAPSLTGGWLGYDDDWLVRDNELLNLRGLDVLARVVGGFDRETRLVLGAEYLPVRDLVTWVARAWLGLDVLGFRVLSLALFVVGCAALLRWSTTLGHDGYLLGAWMFALHPVHAESVAWIAGLKDVLALALLAAALLLASERTPVRRALVVLCVGLACGAKGVAVTAPVLLAVADLIRGRTQDRSLLVASTILVTAWAALHAWVGGVVGMLAEPLGSTPSERVGSVVVLLARYVELSLLVRPSSLLHEVEPHGLDLTSAGAGLFLVLLVAASTWAWQRGARWPAALLLWFFGSLAPVSQALAPLQNRMADRYLLVAVWAPCAAVGLGLEATLARTRPSLGRGLAVCALATLGLLSALRGRLFTDPVALYAEATERTARDARAPLLLADQLLADERHAEAEEAYRIAFARDGLRTDRGRQAGNGLGRILAGTGRVDEAIALYERLVARYPEDPRVLHNLATLEARVGRVEAATRHRSELAARFPDYRPGQDRPGPL
jgi:tetratricopeptide (TPR) repeat protein